MKSISLLVLAAVSSACLFASCSPAKDKNDTTAAGSDSGGTKTSGGTTSSSAGENTAGGEATAGGENTAGGETSTGGQPSQGGNGKSISACGDGVVIVGDPLYNDKPDAGNPKPAGQGTLVDPPVLPSEEIAVIGDKLFLNSEEEIWMADLTGTSPQIKRLAGSRGSKKISAGDLPCKDTRFLVVHGLAATPDGKLVLVDYIGGAVVEITDPAGPDCTSHWVAGTSTETPDPDAYPANHGDVDGPGNMAMFGGDPNVTGIGGAGIHKIAADPDGNYYTWDEGTGKFKKIANDGARTVSTIGHISPDDQVRGLTFLNGKLYAVANNSGSEDVLFEVDPGAYKATDTTKPTKNIKEVFRDDTDQAGNRFQEIAGSGHTSLPGDLENDGEALIMASAHGFIWRVTTDGTATALAGSLGPNGPGRLDFDDGFDPTLSHPAAEWELVTRPSNADFSPWLAVDGGNLYWSGGIGIGEYVVKFGCR